MDEMNGNMIGTLSRRLADREDLRQKDELLLLREFYVRWRRMHAAMFDMRGRELTDVDKHAIAGLSQRLIDQSNAIKEHQK